MEEQNNKKKKKEKTRKTKEKRFSIVGHLGGRTDGLGLAPK